MKRSLFLFLLFLPAVVFSAGTNLTLPLLLDLGITGNHSLARLKLDGDAAQTKVNGTWAAMLVPTARATVNYNRSEASQAQTAIAQQNASDITYTNIYRDNSSAAVTVNKTLFNWFQDNMTLESETRALQTSRKKYFLESTALSNSLTTAWFQWLLYSRAADRALAALSKTSNSLSETLRKEELGQASEIETLQAKVNCRTANAALLKAVALTLSSRRALLVLAGLNPDLEITTTESPSSLEAFIPPAIKPEEILTDYALSNDTELLSLILSADQARLNLAVSENARLPSLSASFSYRLDYDPAAQTSFFNALEQSWSAGLQLSIPLDDWAFFSQTSARLDNLKISATQAQTAVSGRAAAVRESIRNLLDEQETLALTLDAQTDNLKLAELKFSQAQASALRKLITAQALTDAREALEQARLDYYTAGLNLLTLRQKLLIYRDTKERI